MNDDSREFISQDEALKRIGEKETVHVILNPAVNILIGADWHIDEIKKLLSSSQTIEIGGEHCMNMGHPIAVTRDGEHYFLEADNQ